MTTRHSALLVTLDQDLREDDLGAVIAALRMNRHVLSVEPAPVDTLDVHIATARVRSEIGGKLMEVIWPKQQKG